MAAIAVAALVGCYTIRYEHRSVLPEAGAPRERWNHALAGGVIPASRVELAAMCPGGFATVENQTTFPNFLGQALIMAGRRACSRSSTLRCGSRPPCVSSVRARRQRAPGSR